MQYETDKTKESQKLLREIEYGIKSVRQSEAYKAYLNFMAKFHHYSLGNSILIYMQCPEATRVAGRQQWFKNLCGIVNPGEKPIRIFAPFSFKTKVETPVMGEGGNPVLGEDGKEIKEVKEETTVYFRPVSVFDISQVRPKSDAGFPEICHELQGNVENYDELLEALKEVSGVPVSFEYIKGGAKGYFSPNESKIIIQEGMTKIQTIKTLCHEMTHVMLHGDMKNREKSREQEETEAESVAYILCKNLGLDTSGYSFEYLASWNDEDLTEFKNSLETIQKTADEMIKSIRQKLEDLKITRPVEPEGLRRKIS